MRVARWFDNAAIDPTLRKSLLSGVDMLFHELPQRDHWGEVVTSGIDTKSSIGLRVDTERSRAFPTATHLCVSSLVPGWGFGWSNTLGDEFAEETLASLMHYCRQYVHRADVARVLMIAWEEHSVLLHPFGSWGTSHRYGPLRPLPPSATALSLAEEEAIGTLKAAPDDPLSTSSPWLDRNTLDPSIHQAIYHFLRGQELCRQGFELEAVVAWDCTVQCIGQMVQHARKLRESLTRSEVCEALGIPKAGKTAEWAYFLRNNFGAHSGGWRWWDHPELMERGVIWEVEAMANNVLAHGADAEAHIRRIEPPTDSWSNWFTQHFETIWDSVWFEPLDTWESKHTPPSE